MVLDLRSYFPTQMPAVPASRPESRPEGPLSPLSLLASRPVTPRDVYFPETDRETEFGGKKDPDIPVGKLPLTEATDTMRRGSVGPGVRELQTKLRDAGFDPGPIDGDFRKLTRSAVVAFQRAHCLVDDGIVGTETWKALGVAKPPKAPRRGVVERTPDGQMVRRQGQMISASLAAPFDRMVAAAAADGVTLKIRSGYRSYDEQVVLWDRYGHNTKRVARPGHSNHQSGTAIDFARTQGAWAWLAKNATQFGLHNYKPEPWHYSLTGH